MESVDKLYCKRIVHFKTLQMRDLRTCLTKRIRHLGTTIGSASFCQLIPSTGSAHSMCVLSSNMRCKQWGSCDNFYYHTLGCDIQCFRAMGLSAQYWPRWFQDCPVIWLAVPFGANEAHLGICTLSEKIFSCLKWAVSGWNRVFPKENLSCEVSMVTNCPYAGINKWMEKSNIFFHNGTCCSQWQNLKQWGTNW